MLRTRQSASKDGAVENWAGKGLRESLGLSPPKAKPSPVKGTRGALSFHKPVGMKGLLWKRSPFTHRSCGRVFGSALPSALPMPRLWCAHGARTARLLRVKPMASKCFAICGKAEAATSFWRQSRGDRPTGRKTKGGAQRAPPRAVCLRLAKAINLPY